VEEYGYLGLEYDDLDTGIHEPVSYIRGTHCLGFGDEFNLGNCKIFERPRGGCLDSKMGATLVGPVCSVAYVCRSCGCNAHNAMCNRHGAKAPKCTRSFKRFIAASHDVVEEVGRVYGEHMAVYGHHWIDRWPLTKAETILASQQVDGIYPERVKNMVKREVYPKVPTKARCIQFYPNLATQAEFAPETSSLQKSFTQVFYRVQIGKARCTFASGLNAEALGRWLKEVMSDYTDPWCYERDGKNWDATLTKPHNDFKVRMYACAGAKYCEFMNRARVVSGFGAYDNGMLRYKLKETVKSGHNDTTLGNNLINTGITWSSFEGLVCDILVAGDDLLVIVEGDFNADAIAEKERKFGIKPEYRKFHSVEDASFISGLFAKVGEDYAFIPKPGRLLQRLFWTVKPPPPKKLRAYQRGVAKGILATVADVPIIGDWLALVGDEGEVLEVYAERARFYERERAHYDFSGWFVRRYGLTDEEAEEARTILCSACVDRVIVRSPGLDKIIAVDTCDVEEREEEGDL